MHVDLNLTHDQCNGQSCQTTKMDSFTKDIVSNIIMLANFNIPKDNEFHLIADDPKME